jgi:hypothetical protein
MLCQGLLSENPIEDFRQMSHRMDRRGQIDDYFQMAEYLVWRAANIDYFQIWLLLPGFRHAMPDDDFRLTIDPQYRNACFDIDEFFQRVESAQQVYFSAFHTRPFQFELPQLPANVRALTHYNWQTLEIAKRAVEFLVWFSVPTEIREMQRIWLHIFQFVPEEYTGVVVREMEEKAGLLRVFTGDNWIQSSLLVDLATRRGKFEIICKTLQALDWFQAIGTNVCRRIYDNLVERDEDEMAQLFRSIAF